MPRAQLVRYSRETLQEKSEVPTRVLWSDYGESNDDRLGLSSSRDRAQTGTRRRPGPEWIADGYAAAGLGRVWVSQLGPLS